MSLITLTTDFGLASHYPAQMKASILGICPSAQIIDISHAIRPQNVREGAVVLADVTPQFPRGTIHMAVVDPGVGTERKLMYVEVGGQRFLLPDNGLLTPQLSRGFERAFFLDDSRWWRSAVSHTFHGRDILAPVAAHLANGIEPHLLGPACPQPVMLPWPKVHSGHGRLLGEVLLVDSFGNLITNITRTDVEALGPLTALVIRCHGIEVAGIQTTYGLSQPGETITLFDSHDRLEIAVVNGSATEIWQVDECSAVEVALPTGA